MRGEKREGGRGEGKGKSEAKPVLLFSYPNYVQERSVERNFNLLIISQVD